VASINSTLRKPNLIIEVKQYSFDNHILTGILLSATLKMNDDSYY